MSSCESPTSGLLGPLAGARLTLWLKAIFDQLMCGISGIIGRSSDAAEIKVMTASLQHRGPDAENCWIGDNAALGHNRLRIIDLSDAGAQPMTDPSGRFVLVFNGELYNYRELRGQLEASYSFRSHSDSEVVLAAFCRWGDTCLERFIGMFAFAVWDSDAQRLFAARDRFGVKPFFYHLQGGVLYFASEIKALHAAGVPREPNHQAWANYLCLGHYRGPDSSFWQNVHQLPAGHSLSWHQERLQLRRWYDFAARCGDQQDERPLPEVLDEYFGLLQESIALRFRSDVPVGINLSGGLDSSILLALTHASGAKKSDLKAFTFLTNHEKYDELPWVQEILLATPVELEIELLLVEKVPGFSRAMQQAQDEPFGGIPTLAYASLFQQARHAGTYVLMDGQGMDEQWAGYDYYHRALEKNKKVPLVQGCSSAPLHPACVEPSLSHLARKNLIPEPFNDPFRNLQYRDLFYTKLPRALHFNDRASMSFSVELREPFLDHRLIELAFCQPREHKIDLQNGKLALRQLAAHYLPGKLVKAPKRPVQTPQREWLRGPLRPWVEECLNMALQSRWLVQENVEKQWQAYLRGESDNSFYVWQWISIALQQEKP